MSVCAELTKLRGKEKFNTNPDPDPEWLLIRHMRCNIKYLNEALVMFFITKYYTFHLVNN